MGNCISLMISARRLHAFVKFTSWGHFLVHPPPLFHEVWQCSKLHERINCDLTSLDMGNMC